jgi:predicted nucleic acid-binding protein
VLVDTNVLSELVRPKPLPAVLAWAAEVERFTLSVITLEELCFGVRVRESAKLDRWLETLVATADILPVTAPIAERAADFRAKRHRSGRPVTQADMLIAATASVSGVALATRNTRDFTGLGLRLVNPFGR